MGKTTLCATAPKPIIISTENKLLAIAKYDIPVIEVSTPSDLEEAVKYVNSKACKKFQTVCVDSLTDVAESMLASLKKQHADPRRAYGDLADFMGEQIRALRDIKKKHLYCIAKTKKIEDEGITLYVPNMPGKQLLDNIPYFFDFVFAMRVSDDDDEASFRYLQTQPDYKYDAKSVGSNLLKKEEPDLTKVFKKALK